MSEEPETSTSSDEDAFVGLVKWLIRAEKGGAGSLTQLARRSKIPERTLRAWQDGNYPRKRLSQQVSNLDAWARDYVPGYPPPESRGPTFVELAGPRAERRSKSRSDRPPTTGDGSELSNDRPNHDRLADSSRHKLRVWSQHRRILLGGFGVVLAVFVVIGVVAFMRHDSPRSTGTGSVTYPPAGPTITETSDSHLGTPVYQNARGGTVGTAVPSRIPYGTVVQVRCQVQNSTGQLSVTALYWIASGPWRGYFGVSDTFSNGDPVGQTGGHAVDALVPRCP